MSNGEVCCILGICCPPESGAQENALTHEIIKDLGWELTEAQEMARWIVGRFDLAPRGLLAPLLAEVADQARKHPRHE